MGGCSVADGRLFGGRWTAVRWPMVADGRLIVPHCRQTGAVK
jgi:hypothetical protein